MKNPTVKIRIMGDPEIVQRVAEGIQIDNDHFYKEISRPYLNRGDTGDVRVYVTITGISDRNSGQKKLEIKP